MRTAFSVTSITVKTICCRLRMLGGQPGAVRLARGLATTAREPVGGDRAPCCDVSGDGDGRPKRRRHCRDARDVHLWGPLCESAHHRHTHFLNASSLRGPDVCLLQCANTCDRPSTRHNRVFELRSQVSVVCTRHYSGERCAVYTVPEMGRCFCGGKG